MNDEFYNLKKIGAFKGARKDFFMDYLNKKGINCFIKNNDLIIGDNDFLVNVNSDSIFLNGNVEKIKNELINYKKEFFNIVSKNINLKRINLKKSNSNIFLNNQFCPLLFECFNDFSFDFSIIAHKINESFNFKAYYSNNFLNILFNNSSFSILLKNEFNQNNIDMDKNYFLKYDELFLGFPYCFIPSNNNYTFNGLDKDLKIIMNKVLLELQNYSSNIEFAKIH